MQQALNRQAEMNEPAQKPWWRIPFGLALGGFLLIAGFFLITEHTAHVLGGLPFLLLLACPLMHFMHHGHGHSGGHARGDPLADSRSNGRPQHTSSTESRDA